MSNHEIDIVAVRHSAPDLSRGESDPGLLPLSEQRLNSFEEALVDAMSDVQNIAVFHAPTRRTLATARLILDLPWVSERSRRGNWPQELAPLAEIKHLPGYKPQSLDWLKILGDVYQNSLSSIDENEPCALVLVTHAPVIKEIASQLPASDISQPRHVDFLGIRKFSMMAQS